MKLDLNRISININEDKILPPDEIFKVLPEKNSKYDYLRSVQEQVLKQWYLNKDHGETLIKMNTGSGKTLVALLILQSCLNEGIYPAVYIVPDSFLISQVINEANDLGINITDDADDFNFRRGRAILVANIQRLVNGKSVFGMRDDYTRNVPIGSIIIDDVHACIETVDQQFTIMIKSGDVKYDKLLNLFGDDLNYQSSSIYLDILEGVPNKSMLVPYWAWMDKHDKILKILHEGADEDEIIFKLPLIQDYLKLCNCVVSSSKIEISPTVVPINKIVNFINAKRKIFMSATLDDNSPLVSHFDVSPENINIITPETADDLGARMILIPQVINPEINDEDIKYLLHELSNTSNVVVIVPSVWRTEFWRDVADAIYDASTIEEGVANLKSGHVGLVVLMNRYDGIDLPDDACRVLVIDNLPKAKKEYDKIESTAIFDGSSLIRKQIQKIEQGMGRGIRSNNDYCAVLLMGSGLINTLYCNGALEYFSNSTKIQLEISNQVSDQIQSGDLSYINEILHLSINRDKQWMELCKKSLLRVTYRKDSNIDLIIKAYREAFHRFKSGHYEAAANLINELSNMQNNQRLKGWLMQQSSLYLNLIDPIRAQERQKSAVSSNYSLLKPIEGIQYQKNLKKYESQAQNFIDNMKQKGYDSNKFVLSSKAILGQLKFEPETSNEFENAIKELAFHLGVIGSRPEQEAGKGPDDLWNFGHANYFVIECKNGVTNEMISKHDCNQLNGSIEWFENQYGDKTEMTPIMIHLGDNFNFEASPNKNIRIISKEDLDLLKINFNKFVVAICSNGNYQNIEAIHKLIYEYSFDYDNFIKVYTSKFNISNNH